MKILILGAAEQISHLVIEKILKEKKHSLILFARHDSKRIKISDPNREQIIDGDYSDINLVKKALEGVEGGTFIICNEADSLNPNK